MTNAPFEATLDDVGDLAAAANRTASDRQLLESFIESGDETAFATLVERHQGGVWALCRRMLPLRQDAEEAFQAVFLVLARKAGSIKKREALGSWLYGVAYRTALDARQKLARRCSLATALSTWPPLADYPAPACHEPWREAAFRELQQTLDEEVQRLPEKFRAPFVLCCLHGMSRAEAARELGLKEGTLSGRLSLGRQLLHKRLARRGVSLSAALTALALVQNMAAAAAPAALIHGTAPVVLASAAGKAAATPLAPASVTLADGLVKTMVLAKLKTVTAAVLICVALSVTAVAAALHMADDPAGDGAEGKQNAVAPAFPAKSDVWSIAVSADGKFLAAAAGWWDQPGEIGVWDLPTRTPLKRFSEDRGVASVAFSADGKLLASASWSGHVRLRDWPAGTQTADIDVPGVARLAFSPDGALLAVVTERATAQLWDPVRAQLVGDLQADRARKQPVSYACVAFAPDGKRLAAGGNDWQPAGQNHVIVWDVGSKKRLLRLSGHRHAILCVAWSPDGKTIASGSADHTTRLWDADSGRLLKILRGHQHWVESVVFTDGGKTLVSGSHDGTVRFWDLAANKERAPLTIRKVPFRPVQSFFGPDGRVRAVRVTPDGKTLLVGAGPRTLKLFDALTHKETDELWKGDPVAAVAAKPAPSKPAASKPAKLTMDDLPPAPPTADDSGGLSETVVLLILALGVVFALGLGSWAYIRRRRRNVPNAVAAAASLSFRCPGCARPLRAKSALAGKTTRCPQCGKPVSIPEV